MTLLEMRAACVSTADGITVGPVTFALAEGARLAWPCAEPQAAAALARLACALMRPAEGTVFVGAFDTRIQPVQAKRLATFVPHEPFAPRFGSLEAYIEYRADLWELPKNQAVVQARALRERLADVHEAFAYPLIGALVARPRLLVLDRPQPAYAAHIAAVTSNTTVFSTHAGEAASSAFVQAAPVT